MNNTIEYTNDIPDTLPKIKTVSDIFECRYNKDLPKTDNVEEFLKRPIRYAFVFQGRKTPILKTPQYYCIFDKKEKAEAARATCVKKMYQDIINSYEERIKKEVNPLTPEESLHLAAMREKIQMTEK